ncbi:hypothetical protein BH10PAT3_BH10PAT3_6470 [soil metagenome]
MREIPAKHLALVRHGESEGDARRAMRAQPLSHELTKHPRDEEQTQRGHEQSSLSGKWLARYFFSVYGIKALDWQLVSPLFRTQQSAQSLRLPGEWQDDARLAERHRGMIQGMTKQQHMAQYPESYRQMQKHPFHWVPPGGESISRVSHRLGQLVDDFMQSDALSAVLMTHRDVMWAAHVPLDRISLDEIEQINTKSIRNGQIFHYTNVNPQSGQVDGSELVWKRSVTPWGDSAQEQTANWIRLATR